MPIYLDTLIRLTQDIKSTHVSQETIGKFCKILKVEIAAAPELPPEPPQDPQGRVHLPRAAVAADRARAAHRVVCLHQRQPVGAVRGNPGGHLRSPARLDT